VSCAKTAEPIEDSGDPKEACGEHTGSTWRIPLNVHVRLRWGLLSDYFGHLLLLGRITASARCGYIISDQVALSVCLSVCCSREPCKTDEPIEMPLGLWARVGSRNHVLDGVQIPMGRGNFERRRGGPL